MRLDAPRRIQPDSHIHKTRAYALKRLLAYPHLAHKEGMKHPLESGLLIQRPVCIAINGRQVIGLQPNRCRTFGNTGVRGTKKQWMIFRESDIILMFDMIGYCEAFYEIEQRTETWEAS